MDEVIEGLVKPKPRYSIFMNDSHYYIKSIPEKYKCRVFMAGGGFWHAPGKYVLPFSEGSFVVYGDRSSSKGSNPLMNLKVKMITRGTGQTY